MSQKDDKNHLNKAKKIKPKYSLMDLVNKKLYNSKKVLLSFFKGKPLYIIIFFIINYFVNRLYYSI